MELSDEIRRFRDWASRGEHHSAEWESDYPDWSSFQDAFFSFLNETDSADWNAQDWHDVLYAVARDNEGENLIQRVSEDKNLLIKLARKAVNSDEKDAKWQIAQYLGDVAELEAAEPILLLLERRPFNLQHIQQP